jgi:hypothetical protein
MTPCIMCGKQVLQGKQILCVENIFKFIFYATF